MLPNRETIPQALLDELKVQTQDLPALILAMEHVKQIECSDACKKIALALVLEQLAGTLRYAAANP
jgi:hypothetical protein